MQAIPFWIASLLTGLAAVLYAMLFSYAEKGAEWMIHKASWSLFIATPVCFLFAWWLVKKYAPFARGSGIPQVIAAIELSTPKDEKKINKLLNLKVIWVKVSSSLVMAFGGGVVGREGPTIQIAGSIFRTVNQWLPAWWPKISRRNMIMTGAAAGLAAAFNTPLGWIGVHSGRAHPYAYQLFQNGIVHRRDPGRSYCPGIVGTIPLSRVS